MKKYAVTWTRGDNMRVVGLYDSKEDALAAMRIRQGEYEKTRALYNVILGNFDEHGNLTENRYLMYY